MIARIFCLLLMVLTAPLSLAAESVPDNKSIYLYQGPDRDRQLVERAKKDGKLNYFSTMTVADAQALATAFEKKYGIKVKVWRGSAKKVLQRTISETIAKRYEVDEVG